MEFDNIFQYMYYKQLRESMIDCWFTPVVSWRVQITFRRYHHDDSPVLDQYA